MKRNCIMWLVALTICSCSTETALQRLLGTSAAAPVFYGCKTSAEGEVDFLFSSAVTVVSMYFDPPMEAEALTQGETVTIRFETSQPGGSRITADMLVEDKNKNTLNILVNFRTRNNRMPDFVINEIRTSYTKPKVEFIELKMLQAGNLGALRLFAAYDKDKEAIFEFPPVEVKAGEYVVVHTRSIESGLVDETGTRLSESKGTDASSGRDFWIPGTLKIHSTNTIYAMDQDDRIIDGILLVNSKYPWKEPVAAAANLLVSQGAWSGGSSDEAVLSDDATVTRTICRGSRDSNSSADWYITVTSGATPGGPNNPGRYR
ncbi:MAG: hypothetical protein LBP60_09700 [Spirochaetaceae bacterium]|jgi:hypothetical protein|nr:hypothetical protein [Spirochaetaceae bacterium]